MTEIASFNPRRKCKSWHITINGHGVFSTPSQHREFITLIGDTEQIEKLAYCEELGALNQNPHTHICLVFNGGGLSKKKLMEILLSLGYDPGLNCKTHNHWQTIYNDHLGLNEGKPRCWGFKQLIGIMDLDRYLRDKRKHRERSREDRMELNQELMEKGEDGILDAVCEGRITLKDAPYWERGLNRVVLMKKHRDLKGTIDKDPPKDRHLYIWGGSNTGKTIPFLRRIIALDPDNWFQIPTNNDWSGYNLQKYLYMDEFKGQITETELKRITMGDAKVNTKGSTVTLRGDVVVVLLSEYTLKESYPNLPEDKFAGLFNRFTVLEKRTTEDRISHRFKRHQDQMEFTFPPALLPQVWEKLATLIQAEIDSMMSKETKMDEEDAQMRA